MTSRFDQPAFPVPSYVNSDGETHDVEFKGMTLRDYFAAHAMQGMMAMPLPDMEDDAPKFLAKTAYGIADAMLKARDAQT
jgi:hypothetical protein